ncbi:PREDICTED: protein naked cuticle-like [Rhagoletis zephyria]|uniref:protein naked cuticle-like n=1 Tax=Rhagoletis zephyria TaxID=28612 RepID=UPI000811A655|nr:PREDICTED: protein naked cuticle-like [Rhagoletis zephyria]
MHTYIPYLLTCNITHFCSAFIGTFRKPQANVSPIRQPQYQHLQPHSQLQQQQQQQRQRSNTVSKIPTLIANHSNAIISHNSSCIMPNSSSNNNNNAHNTSSANNNSHHHHHHHSHSHNNSNNHSHSHSNSSSHSHSSNHTNNNSSELNLHDISTSNNTNQYHPQPHIPIYHQQLAINPAILAAQSGMHQGQHNKMNLCGYDSFLHATICGGGTTHSPPPSTAVAANATTLVPQIVNYNNQQPTQQLQQQLIATVQPIMTAVPSSNVTPAKVFLNSTTHQIKTSKILRSGSYSQQQAQQSVTAHNSPQYHGYQRLSSASAHYGHHHHHSQQQLHQQCANKLAALNITTSAGAQLERSPTGDHIERWLKNSGGKHQQRKEPNVVKNADNSLYAKLSEKLQDSILNKQQPQPQQQQQHHSQRENAQRRKHKSAHKTRVLPAALVGNVATAQKTAVGIHSSSSNGSIGNYAALIPINGDPTECENLIAPTTTDDEALSEAPAAVAKLFAACNADATQVKEKATANSSTVTTGGADETSKESERNVATAKLVDLSDDSELVAVGADAQAVSLRVSDAAEVDEVEGELEEEEQEGAVMEATGGGSGSSGGASSLIHRYVHEHIHHHYHHFEEKDE